MLIYTCQDLLASAQPRAQLGAQPPRHRCQNEELRHILLGSPEAIRQTIHQLHVLSYAESLLWSPVTTVGEQLVITRAQGEAMSLLRLGVRSQA